MKIAFTIAFILIAILFGISIAQFIMIGNLKKDLANKQDKPAAPATGGAETQRASEQPAEKDKSFGEMIEEVRSSAKEMNIQISY